MNQVDNPHQNPPLLQHLRSAYIHIEVIPNDYSSTAILFKQHLAQKVAKKRGTSVIPVYMERLRQGKGNNITTRGNPASLPDLRNRIDD
jgi:hypothetical protein